MQRRSFLKSILGFLALPFMPEAKSITIMKKGSFIGNGSSIDIPLGFEPTGFSMEGLRDMSGISCESDIYAPNNPNSKVKWRKYENLEPSTQPLFEDLEATPVRFNEVEGIKEDLDFIEGDQWTAEDIKELKKTREHINYSANQIFGFYDELKC